MASLFKPVIVRYVVYLDAQGQRVSKGTEGAKPRRYIYLDAQGRLVSKGTPDAIRQRVSKETPGAIREKKRAVKYYGRYIGADGLEQRDPLDKNKDLAHDMLTERARAARREAAGLADPFEQHRKRPLAEHLADFRRAMAAKDGSPKHVEMTYVRLQTIFDGCGFRKLPDLDANRVADWLKDARENSRAAPIPSDGQGVASSYADIARHFGVGVGTITYWRKRGAPIKPRGRNDLLRIARWRRDFLKGDGISVATSNHYLTAVKSFGNWLVKSRRSPDNPFRHLSALNAKTDVRRERRVLSDAEFCALVSAARGSGQAVFGLSGPDRAMLYITAAYTGLRAGELASLSEASLELESKVPTAAVAAAYSKRRRRDEQPLRPDLAALLREWLQGKASKAPRPRAVVPMRETGQTSPGREKAPPRGKLWPGKWHDDAAEMLRYDLDAAGIPYEDPEGRVFDFHALRHQFISNLAAAGVHPKMAQTLARHSSIGLTMDRYTHLAVADAAGALDKLPALPAELTAGELRASGTAGAAGTAGARGATTTSGLFDRGDPSRTLENTAPSLPGVVRRFGKNPEATETGGAADVASNPVFSGAGDDPTRGAEVSKTGGVFMRRVAPNPDFSCPGVSASVRTVEPVESKKKRLTPRESKELGKLDRSCLPMPETRPAGFEPATCGLEVRCSIQLSYGRSVRCFTVFSWSFPLGVLGLIPVLTPRKLSREDRQASGPSLAKNQAGKSRPTTSRRRFAG